MRQVYFEHLGRYETLSELAFENGLEMGLIVKIGTRFVHSYVMIVKHGKDVSGNFVRITKPKTKEQIQMKKLSSTLVEVVSIDNALPEVCPACEVGKPMDEVLEIHTN